MEVTVVEIVATLCLTIPHFAAGFSTGNISSICDTLEVRHGSTEAQTGPSPYRIIPSAGSYTCGDTVSVFLTAEPNSIFQGFMCQARTDEDEISTGLVGPDYYKMNEWCGKMLCGSN